MKIYLDTNVFADMLSCAVNAGCELILTRNGAHYKNGPLSAYL